MPSRKKSTLLSTLLGDISPVTEVIEKVNRFLVERERSKPVYIPKGYHPSSLNTDTCPRLLVYERLGVKSTAFLDAQTLRIFGDGTDRGNRIQRSLVESGVIREDATEVPIHGADTPEKRVRFKPDMLKLIDAAAKRTKEYEFRGHADFLDLANERGPTVGEIKGCNTVVYDRLREPLPKHVVQASIYADAFGFARILFLYENKNTQEQQEFFIPPDQAALKTVKGIVKVAQRGLAKGQLPDRIDECPSKTSKRACRCPFVATCFSTKKFDELDSREGIEPRDYR